MAAAAEAYAVVAIATDAVAGPWSAIDFIIVIVFLSLVLSVWAVSCPDVPGGDQLRPIGLGYLVLVA